MKANQARAWLHEQIFSERESAKNISENQAKHQNTTKTNQKGEMKQNIKTERAKMQRKSIKIATKPSKSSKNVSILAKKTSTF